MLKQFYLKKEYQLIAATLILSLICYKLAFKQTLEAWQANRQLKAQLAQAADLSEQPAYQVRKNLNLDKAITLYKADTVAFRNNSISTISIIAAKENVKLSEVPVQDPLFSSGKFLIQKLDFEGDFFSLTKTLNNLQSTPAIGMIRSAAYRITNTRTNLKEDKKLELEIYLEIVK